MEIDILMLSREICKILANMEVNYDIVNHDKQEFISILNEIRADKAIIGIENFDNEIICREFSDYVERYP